MFTATPWDGRPACRTGSRGSERRNCPDACQYPERIRGRGGREGEIPVSKGLLARCHGASFAEPVRRSRPGRLPRTYRHRAAAPASPLPPPCTRPPPASAWIEPIRRRLRRADGTRYSTIEDVSMSSADRSTRRRAPATMALALGAGLLAAPAVSAHAAEAPGPAARYTFDQDDLASGKITASSGNALTASLVNGSTAQSVAGTDGGKALALPCGAPTSDGAYVQLPREVLGDASDLTVSARVKWSGDTSSWQRIFDLGTDTTKYLFTTPYNGSVLRTAVTTGGGGAEAQVSGYAPLPADAWRTVTVTLDTSAGRVTTYLDGVAVSSAKTTVKAMEL